MLEAKKLKKTFLVKDFRRRFGSKRLVAVDELSFRMKEGQTLGLVGESGCGKSTLARMLALLTEPDSGKVLFDGKDTADLFWGAVKEFRRNVQIIFQDPMSSLNPRMKMGDVLGEPFIIHPKSLTGKLEEAVVDLLQKVGLSAEMKDRYPHELSGGERQRVCIARAIALKPRVVICDEPVSSLDVLVQAQILNLLLKLQKETCLSFLFISHDLRVVRHMSDEVMVMAEGHIVESGLSDQVFSSPRDPYTRKLLESVDLSDLAAIKS